MNSKALRKRVAKIEESISQSKGGGQSIVVGIVSPDGDLSHCLDSVTLNVTHKEPSMYIPAALEPVLKTKKRFIVVIGGRGSGKSVGVADICLLKAMGGMKTFCLREFQRSINDSVHALFDQEIERLGLEGFDVQKSLIKYAGSERFKYAGLARNIESVKSAAGFGLFWSEEAQTISANSLTVLTPTARNKAKNGLPNQSSSNEDTANVQMIFTANPASEEDAFSQRFIVPFQDAIDRDGFYEDDMHLVVKMNYNDNPWFCESGLEAERQWDYENKPRALYNHIWEGGYNDSIENALIMQEWFDACIDAHIKLGIEPSGARFAAHDPSDIGADSKGYAARQGMVFYAVEEMTSGDINEGGHWAMALANAAQIDFFTWDCDGMGVGLTEQINKSIVKGTMKAVQFKGSESPDNPDSIYVPCKGLEIANKRKIKDHFLNKRAQYYFRLRDLIHKTYRAVVHGDPIEEGEYISFCSKISSLSKLRSELCRLPVKYVGGGKFALYTKQEMKTKFNVKSPNLADSVMMCLREEYSKPSIPVVKAPISRGVYGGSKRNR